MSEATLQVDSTSFDALLSKLKDDARPANISPAKFAAALDYPLQIVAELAHVHRNTVRNNPYSADLQGYMRDAVRVLQAATDLRGDVDDALFWFKNHPIRDFDRKTADRLVAEGKSDAVLRYLRTLEAGATG
ncbi:MAG: hypothetical protein JWQ90_331 [Hydrocarboniphaga sp.]|uniref:hypothetical protein n=1 Tax=Hydrocarboniphaga sp. TaxID=2033016 RepID=UPI00260CBF93|nr:hypothetical protein [Hydrocarboniphaga sp.]MDB5967881.1 hypothetical protein [Hydrocarboniphaga sp.]